MCAVRNIPAIMFFYRRGAVAGRASDNFLLLALSTFSF